ncbi:hypothetical protein LTR62_007780 [Meristemomyces frigidus]|uniref:Uncharacterized protein n=1 Tax=Meristemomyces frigidus TaxID=1508187 RepID=A0AAN7YNP1_9PEZI|nr:hypothetical protein LTR62_007780 [Meristemomyces frigidus]
MGGPNLEVFKFGMYILFPIGIMYYFGTNLDSRFSTPDFWPKEGSTHVIPFEREDIKEELDRLRQRRLFHRAKRMELEQAGQLPDEVTTNRDEVEARGAREILGETKLVEPMQPQTERESGKGSTWFGWLK